MERTDHPEDDQRRHDQSGLHTCPPGRDDVNLVLLRGRVVTAPDVRRFESGATSIRYLATIRQVSGRYRLDVIPITVWNPPEALIRSAGTTADRICVIGTIQRRFWPSEAETAAPRSRIEVVASDVHIEPAAEPG